MPKSAWRNVAWREATGDRLTSRFARVRVRPARHDPDGTRPEEWLLIEWPKGEPDPTKYWLSTLPEDISFARLVDLAKLRWRIERDYQELKQELGHDASHAGNLAVAKASSYNRKRVLSMTVHCNPFLACG